MSSPGFRLLDEDSHAGDLLGRTLRITHGEGGEGRKSGQREKLGHDAVTVTVSTNPIGSYRA